ncbi:MAG: bacterioferritin [Proteobacteria bacterium]|nr:bacterioferritin [Pseudomonadota bacterium]
MKGNRRVIDAMNGLLAAELAAMDQYFIHSKMYEDWGLARLHERVAHEFDDEKGHAGALIERILFLEGTPDVATREPINVGKDVPAMLKSDLELEYRVVAALKEAIGICEKERDYQSREVLERLLADTEIDHAYWLEKQLGLIDRVGLRNYLQSQMG